MKNYYALLLSGAALLPAAPALAQDSIIIADIYKPEITVTAAHGGVDLEKTGQQVSTLNAEEIENAQPVQAVDLLARLPGVSITPSGGLGQPTSVHVRGGDNAQTLVLVDGVRINDPADVGGGFDFGSLMAVNFDRVELLRGSASTVWGSRAIGGVVNFSTADANSYWAGKASGEYGARNRTQLAASVSGPLGPVELSAGAGWLKTDGYSVFSEARGGAEKDGFESKSGFAKARIFVTDSVVFNAGGFYSDADYDYDNYGSDALHKGNKRDITGFAYAEYGDGKLSGRAGYTITDTHRNSTHALYGPYITDGRSELFEARASYSLAGRVKLAIGAESENTRFEDNYGSVSNARSESLYARLSVSPLEGLWVNGGARQDWNRDYGDQTSFSADAAYKIGGLILRASYSEGFKAPSLYQLYTNGGFRALEAETAKSYDAGAEFKLDRNTNFTLTYFRRDTRNLIDYDFTSYDYYNIGRVRAQGIELGLQYEYDVFDARVSSMYLDATDLSTGNQLARRPKTNLFASFGWKPLDGMRLAAEFTHGAARWDDNANSLRVDGYNKIDFKASYELTQNVTLFGRVENVTDASYELVYSYGTPGRSATVGIQAGF